MKYQVYLSDKPEAHELKPGTWKFLSTAKQGVTIFEKTDYLNRALLDTDKTPSGLGFPDRDGGWANKEALSIAFSEDDWNAAQKWTGKF
jgi:hypothetical protein